MFWRFEMQEYSLPVPNSDDDQIGSSQGGDD
jgi:hypothetical protein